ncbi:MAG: hypothetical protein JWP10_2022, partial [Nocardioidaceae bacterium]|nr:hypothetical protein [Nocardioidaceae bacterium]
MKVFVTGATGVMGTSIARALLSAGHDVKGLVRESSLARARSMDFEPFVGDLFDPSSLATGMRGCDVVCNAATHVPVRNGVLRPGAWRVNDRIRSAGSRAVGAAALEAGVSRLVQGSVSFTYADQGGDV